MSIQPIRTRKREGFPSSTKSNSVFSAGGPLIREHPVTPVDSETFTVRCDTDSPAEVEKLEASLAALNLSAYPVLTLPTEITSRIFIHCLPTHGRVRPRPSTAPLILAQICRHWRDVALSTCQLWSSIYLDFPFQHAECIKSSENALRLLKTWVSRAKGHPLSLGLDKNPKDLLTPQLMSMISSLSSFQKKISSALLSFVSSLFGQIQCLEACISAAQFRQILPLHSPLLLLRYLASPYSADINLPELLKRAPSLRELCLLGPPSPVNFSSALLTSLEITPHISVRSFFGVLPKFPALSHFKCRIDFFDARAMPAKPAVHPHLSSLSIHGYESSLILNALILPNLRNLDIFDYPFFDVILSLVLHSSCVLQSLAIGIEEFDQSQLASFLAAFPSLEVLEIDVCPDVNRLLACICTPSLLPRLNSITISASRSNIDYGLLVVLLRRRRNPIGVVKLQSMHINLPAPMDPNDEDDEEYWEYHDFADDELSWPPDGHAASELKQFVADGLDLVLKLKGDRGSKYWPDSSKGAPFLLAEYGLLSFAVVDPLEDSPSFPF